MIALVGVKAELVSLLRVRVASRFYADDSEYEIERSESSYRRSRCKCCKSGRRCRRLPRSETDSTGSSDREDEAYRERRGRSGWRSQGGLWSLAVTEVLLTFRWLLLPLPLFFK